MIEVRRSRLRSSSALLLTACALFLGTTAHAECTGGDLSVLPAPGVGMPTNFRILLDGYGFDADLIENIERRHPVLVQEPETVEPRIDGVLRQAIDRVQAFLASQASQVPETVQLRVAEKHRGAMGRVQAVLAPVRTLRPRSRYVLWIDDGPGRRPVIAGSEDEKEIRAAWRTGDGPDESAPVWSARPRGVGGHNIGFACGSEIAATVSSWVQDGEPARALLVLADVWPAGSERHETYLLKIRDHRVAIGHGMCSGAFKLEPGSAYNARLTAIDVAGNASPAPGEPLTILGPQSQDTEDPSVIAADEREVKAALLLGKRIKVGTVAILVASVVAFLVWCVRRRFIGWR